MSSEDIEYYRVRAATERTRASEAPTDEIAHAHLMLATMYENIIDRMEQQPTASDRPSQPLRSDQPTD